jgi:pimeloyl-ACP methyl ester carboxylesterase
MRRARGGACIALLASLAATTVSACTNDKEPARAQSATSTPTPNRSKVPLPPRVHVRSTPQGIKLADPRFTPVEGARADFGRLGGAVYQIEMPSNWNGRLLLYMHGFEELGPEAAATAPDFRRYLIGHGYAWGASSFSSTGLIPGRSTDETAALWDYFARKYGRPKWTYVSGLSMGGMAAHIAAERYADRFDGALALCGAAGQTPALSIGGDFFAGAAYTVGLTQAQFDASTDMHELIGNLRAGLRPPDVHRRFEDIMIALTGGPRAFDREGFELEEETNWRRLELSVTAQIASNRDTKYDLGSFEGVTSAEFNRAVIRLPVNRQARHNFLTGNETTGQLQMPLISLHSTGDGQVPINQAQILQRKVDAAGKSDLLVQRVIRDASHCGFTTNEQAAGFEALVRWVERGEKPKGTNVLVSDLRKLNRTFELAPREGLGADSVPGADDRVTVRGSATIDGKPFDARFLGAIDRRPGLGGLVTACQGVLPPVERGRFEIPVLAAAEATGCGFDGARIVLWTFVDDRQLYSTNTVAWPGNGRTLSFDATFSSSTPQGVAPVIAGFQGEVVRRDGRQFPPGTVVEAYVGDTRCGIASTRRAGNFSGYILDVVGPDAIAGCTRGATLTFRVDGLPAVETAVNTPPGQNDSLDLTVR